MGTEAEKAIEEFTSKTKGFSNPKKDPKPPSEELQEPIVPSDMGDLGEETAPLTYAERLEKLSISDEKAMKIIDEMCDKGSYIESHTIRKARGDKEEIKAVFMTRDTRTQGFIVEKVAALFNNKPLVYNKLMSELQLAASMIYYNGNKYPPISEIDDDDKYEEVLFERVKVFSKIASPLMVVLIRKLSMFDLEVTASMAPGYEDFF